MVRKVHKTFNLPLDVVEEIEEESNQSEAIEKAWREHRSPQKAREGLSCPECGESYDDIEPLLDHCNEHA